MYILLAIVKTYLQLKISTNTNEGIAHWFDSQNMYDPESQPVVPWFLTWELKEIFKLFVDRHNAELTKIGHHFRK